MCECFSAVGVGSLFEHLWRTASGIMCECSAIGVGTVIENFWRALRATLWKPVRNPYLMLSNFAVSDEPRRLEVLCLGFTLKQSGLYVAAAQAGDATTPPRGQLTDQSGPWVAASQAGDATTPPRGKSTGQSGPCAAAAQAGDATTPPRGQLTDQSGPCAAAAQASGMTTAAGPVD